VTRAVIITHGTLGRALMDTVEGTLGPQSDVDVLTNEGLSLDQIVERVEGCLHEQPTVLFVDFCGGSPYIACKTLQPKRQTCAVISGVNLPMLFSFFTKRRSLHFAELITIIETDGHRGIQLISA
jgi:mannose/fructose-specific phosphotransferase system component IIA